MHTAAVAGMSDHAYSRLPAATDSFARLPGFAAGRLSYFDRTGLWASSFGVMPGDAGVSDSPLPCFAACPLSYFDRTGLWAGSFIGMSAADATVSADASTSMCDAGLHDSATMPYAGVSADAFGCVSYTIAGMSDASGILSGDAAVSANARGCVSDTIARMSNASGVLSGDATMSANARGCVSDTIARMSNASGILSRDRVMSHTIARLPDASVALSSDTTMSADAVMPHTIARMSDASGVLSGDGVMSVSAGRVSDEALSDLAGLSHVIAAVLSGGDAGRPLWGRAR